ncbi:MAG TPA: PHB depolymerase family esterase [Terriglobales bacterium]|nr:PHB depolymerase family esterase [Terriglobales bacterium]
MRTIPVTLLFLFAITDVATSQQHYQTIYVPTTVVQSPALVVCLHGTTLDSTGTHPPTNWCGLRGWKDVADRFGFVLYAPTSTWNPKTKSWMWNAYNMDFLFPASSPPDDSGFLRSNIQQIIGTYSINPKRVFVIGSSSGGFMAHRVGIESGDLVAAIASLSGQLWYADPTLPSPSGPVSLFECHGAKDTFVPSCGGTKAIWGKTKEPFASMDDDLNFWLQTDGLPPNPSPFCTAEGGSFTGVPYVDEKTASGVEVLMYLDYENGHPCEAYWPQIVWGFFLTHAKP